MQFPLSRRKKLKHFMIFIYITLKMIKSNYNLTWKSKGRGGESKTTPQTTYHLILEQDGTACLDLSGGGERRDLRMDLGLSSSSSSVLPCRFFRIDLGCCGSSHSSSSSSSSLKRKSTVFQISVASLAPFKGRVSR